MKIITSLLATCMVITMLCMEDEQITSQSSKAPESLSSYTTLTELITRNISKPELIRKELDKFPAKTLRSYHYGNHNNLLHCLVENLIEKNEDPNFSDLIERHKPVFRTLVYNNGLEINEVNDHHSNPLTMAYIAYSTKDREISNKIYPLIQFLETQLHANPSYFSVAPELRILKQIAWEFITCQWCYDKND